VDGHYQALVLFGSQMAAEPIVIGSVVFFIGLMLLTKLINYVRVILVGMTLMEEKDNG
jgi:hypothetical protein